MRIPAIIKSISASSNKRNNSSEPAFSGRAFNIHCEGLQPAQKGGGEGGFITPLVNKAKSFMSKSTDTILEKLHVLTSKPQAIKSSSDARPPVIDARPPVIDARPPVVGARPPELN